MKRFIVSALICLVSLTAYAEPPKTRLVVATSYPEEVFSRFETVFETQHPDINVDILWQRPLSDISALEKLSVDVYWAPSRANFLRLSQANVLQKLNIDRQGLPETIGSFLLADPNGYYTATEIAGFGFILNTEYLQQNQLVEPKEWSDLTEPGYATHLVFPIPSKVGFAPAIIDFILQAYGWQTGWALLSGIVSNAELMDFSQGETIVDRVMRGKQGIGITIDFFAASKIANGAPLNFVYPKITAYSPAYVAIMAKTTVPEAAQQFVEFLLSDQGQKTLFDSDIRKLPVRPTSYQAAPENYYNPFAAVESSRAWFFDNQLGLKSQGVNVALFDQLFTQRQQLLKQMQHAIQRAEGRLKYHYSPELWQKLQQSKALAIQVPITAEMAAQPNLQQIFLQRKFSEDAAIQAAIFEKQWGAIVEQNYRDALQLTQEILATVP